MGKWTAPSDIDYYEDAVGGERVRCETPGCDGWITFPACECFCSDCLIAQRLRNAQHQHELSREKRSA